MKTQFSILLLFFSATCFSQNIVTELLKKFNKETVPYITVKELAYAKTDVILLDTREKNEFNISRIENAIYAGYNYFDVKQIKKLIKNKNQPIVVYCSLGLRSETIGEKLQNAGYKNIKNLQGGIFEWKNSGFEVYDTKGKLTDSIHTFSEKWSKWLKKGIKVYPK